MVGLVRDVLYPSPSGYYWFSVVYWLIGEGVRDAGETQSNINKLNNIPIKLVG